MGSDHDFWSAHPGSRDAQIRQVDIYLAQRDISTQAFQREHVARRGQALVLPAAISGTLIQVGLQAVLAQQQVFAQAGQQAVGQQLFARVDVFGAGRKHFDKQAGRRTYIGSRSVGSQASTRSG